MQDAAIVLCLKIVLVSGFTSLVAWVAVYTALTRGGAWKNPIGLTLILKSVLVAATFLVVALGMFFPWFQRHPRFTGWLDVSLIGLVSPIMWWRTAVWFRLHKAGRLPRNGHDG